MLEVGEVFSAFPNPGILDACGALNTAVVEETGAGGRYPVFGGK